MNCPLNCLINFFFFSRKRINPLDSDDDEEQDAENAQQKEDSQPPAKRRKTDKTIAQPNENTKRIKTKEEEDAEVYLFFIEIIRF